MLQARGVGLPRGTGTLVRPCLRCRGRGSWGAFTFIKEQETTATTGRGRGKKARYSYGGERPGTHSERRVMREPPNEVGRGIAKVGLACGRLDSRAKVGRLRAKSFDGARGETEGRCRRVQSGGACPHPHLVERARISHDGGARKERRDDEHGGEGTHGCE